MKWSVVDTNVKLVKSLEFIAWIVRVNIFEVFVSLSSPSLEKALNWYSITKPYYFKMDKGCFCAIDLKFILMITYFWYKERIIYLGVSIITNCTRSIFAHIYASTTFKTIEIISVRIVAFFCMFVGQIWQLQMHTNTHEYIEKNEGRRERCKENFVRFRIDWKFDVQCT